MAIRTISNTGGLWSNAATWVEGEVPTNADDVVATATSGNITLTANGYCRSIDLTGFTGTITVQNCWIIVGNNTPPPNGIAILLRGYVSLNGGGINPVSTASGNHLINLDGVAMAGTQQLSIQGTAEFTLEGTFSCTTNISVTAGTLNFGNCNATIPGLALTGTTAKVINLGSATIKITGSTLQLSNAYTTCVEAATAKITIAQVTTIACSVTTIDGLNLSGVELNIEGNTYGVTFSNSITLKQLYINPISSKTITIASGKTLTLANLYCYPKNGQVTFSGGTISVASGVINMYNVNTVTTIFTGGATFKLRNNFSTNLQQLTYYGLTVERGISYIDMVDGDDTPYIAYGFYKVVYSNATGTVPQLGTIFTGQTSGSTAKLSFIDEWEWAQGSGTLYFEYRSDNFVAENVSSASSSFSIAGNLISGAWKTVSGGALAARINPGDIIRVAKSGDPVSIGNATWTGMTESGEVNTRNISSSTNTSPIVLTCSTAHELQTGDYVFVTGHNVNTKANGTFKITVIDSTKISLDGSTGNGVGTTSGSVTNINCKTIVLATAQTLDIDDCENLWTANPTGDCPTGITLVTPGREGNYYNRLTFDAAIQVNKLQAYKTIPVTDYSSYNAISLWLNSNYNIVEGNFIIKLCSDASGVTAVDTFLIPAAVSSVFYPLVLKKAGGGTLGASIRSIAIYTGDNVTGIASKYISIDNVMACNDTGLNLLSLITKNPLAQCTDQSFEGAFGIMSIKDKLIVLDSVYHANPVAARGYYGTSELVETYIRQPAPGIVPANNSAIYSLESGSADFTTDIEGGFDKTTGLQNGETIFDGLNGNSLGVQINNYNRSNWIGAVRCFNAFGLRGNYSYVENIGNVVTSSQTGLWITGSYNIVNKAYNINLGGNTTGGIYFTGNFNVINEVYNLNSSYSHAIRVDGHGNKIISLRNACGSVSNTIVFSTGFTLNEFNIINAKANGSGVFLNNANNNIITIESLTCNTQGILLSGAFNNKVQVGNLAVTSILTSGVCLTINGSENEIIITNGVALYGIASDAGLNYLQKSTFNVTKLFLTTSGRYSDPWVYSYEHDNIPGNHKMIGQDTVITFQTDVKHDTDSGSWKTELIDPSSIGSCTRRDYYPVKLKIHELDIITANKQVTVTAWIKKDHATDIEVKLVHYGTIKLGTATVANSAANNTDWQQVSIQFTPTKAGIADIYVETIYINGLSNSYAGSLTFYVEP